MTSGDDASVRADKWLWAARFYKTRTLATQAINGGKVHVNGERIVITSYSIHYTKLYESVPAG